MLTKEIEEKFKFIKIQDENYEDYANLEKKLQNENVANNIDKSILEKFNKKKKAIEEDYKNTDKLARDARMMETRRNDTWKRRKASSDEEVEDAFL